MVRLLLGIYTEEGGVVKYSTPNFTKKEANQLLDNVLFSANIYGQSSSKKDISFTLPIMYLPGYTHGRIYFKFSSNSQKEEPQVLEALIFPVKDYYTSLFCSFHNLTDELDSEIISDLDNLVWNFLNSDMEEINFNNLLKGINDLVESIPSSE